MKRRTVGVPRALLYHRYSARWRTLLEATGAEVIVSPPTSAEILREGLRHCFSDFCLPIKAMLGHVAVLSESVDHLFIPRYVSVEHDAFMCPKFLGLPDVIRASFHRLPPLVAPQFHVKDGGEEKARETFARGLAHDLGINRKEARRAVAEAWDVEEDVHERVAGEGRTNIAVIGRPYLMFDNHLSAGVIRNLKAAGVNVVCGTPDLEELERTMGGLIKRVYWSMGKEIVGEAEQWFADGRVSGVVHLVNATCGPDSFATEVIKPIQRKYKKPYMIVTVDEHTSDVGVQTRLEAFIDMMEAARARGGGA